MYDQPMETVSFGGFAAFLFFVVLVGSVVVVVWLLNRRSDGEAWERELLDARPNPGWFADPHQLGVQRWWDGERWTEHTHRSGG